MVTLLVGNIYFIITNLVTAVIIINISLQIGGESGGILFFLSNTVKPTREYSLGYEVEGGSRRAESGTYQC